MPYSSGLTLWAFRGVCEWTGTKIRMHWGLGQADGAFTARVPLALLCTWRVTCVSWLLSGKSRRVYCVWKVRGHGGAGRMGGFLKDELMVA